MICSFNFLIFLTVCLNISTVINIKILTNSNQQTLSYKFTSHIAAFFSVVLITEMLENCTVKMLRRFFANFWHEIGCEKDQTYIFRFLKYLSTFFYTYLSANIHFQFIIITNVSILTDPVMKECERPKTTRKDLPW